MQIIHCEDEFFFNTEIHKYFPICYFFYISGSRFIFLIIKKYYHQLYTDNNVLCFELLPKLSAINNNTLVNPLIFITITVKYKETVICITKRNIYECIAFYWYL